jgi:hypothetical protein
LATRILIKLDIEGMEIDVLKTFVPSEDGAVYLVGEPHEFDRNNSALRKIFHDNGWSFEYIEIGDNHSTFRACSPAAFPLLASMVNVKK